MPPEHPSFAVVALKVLRAQKPNALVDQFATETGIGMLLNGKSGRIKEVANITVGPDRISCNVTVAEYSAFDGGFTPNGPSRTYAVVIQGETLATLIAALKAEPPMHSGNAIVFG